jgi:hypothetical protein
LKGYHGRCNCTQSLRDDGLEVEQTRETIHHVFEYVRALTSKVCLMVNRLQDRPTAGVIGDEFTSSSDSIDESLAREAKETHERVFHWQTQGDEGPILTARRSWNWPKCQNPRRTALSDQRRVCIQHEGIYHLLFSIGHL